MGIAISNDRTQRVRSAPAVHFVMSSRISQVGKNAIRSGDLCIFKAQKNGVLAGRVLFLSSIVKSRREKGLFVTEWSDCVRNVNIGAQCIWYHIQTDAGDIAATLRQSSVFSHGLCPCSNYICHIPPPVFVQPNDLQISSETIRELTCLLNV